MGVKMLVWAPSAGWSCERARKAWGLPLMKECQRFLNAGNLETGALVDRCHGGVGIERLPVT